MITVVTDATGLIIMLSEGGTPEPPPGCVDRVLSPVQYNQLKALAAIPNGGITFDGVTFTAKPFVPPMPFDFSNFDNLDKTLKAFGLVVRDYTNGLLAGTYTNKTVTQIKADFTAKYNSLP